MSGKNFVLMEQSNFSKSDFPIYGWACGTSNLKFSLDLCWAHNTPLHKG